MVSEHNKQTENIGSSRIALVFHLESEFHVIKLVCVCVCERVCVWVCVCVSAWVCVYVWVYECMCVCECVWVCVCVCVCVCEGMSIYHWKQRQRPHWIYVIDQGLRQENVREISREKRATQRSNPENCLTDPLNLCWFPGYACSGWISMRRVKKLLESCELNASQAHKRLRIIHLLPAAVESPNRHLEALNSDIRKVRT